MMASRMTPFTEPRTKRTDRTEAESSSGGSVCATRGRRPRCPSRVEVEALPALRRTPKRRDDRLDARCWSAAQKHRAHSLHREGRSWNSNDFDWEVVQLRDRSGLAFSRTSYSNGRSLQFLKANQILLLHCSENVLGASPFDCSKPGFKSIMTCVVCHHTERITARARSPVGPQEILPEVVQLLLRESVSGQARCRMGTLEAL